MQFLRACLLTGLAVAATCHSTSADDSEVRQFLSQYTDAFNDRNLEAVSAMWAENCTHFDRETGERLEGRAAMQKNLGELFQGQVQIRISGKIDRIRFVRPDVVRVDGTTTTSIPDEDPTIAVFSAIIVKQGTTWQIDSAEESPLPQPAVAAEALRELDWLEGSWVDESGDSRVVSTFRWSPTRTFLIRSISEETDGEVSQMGTEVIGWDPRSLQIRSWTFQSDGAFGDGIWSKVDTDWMIRSSQTLADGQASSGTFVLTPVDNDVVTLRLIGHEIEGQPQPASEPVSIRRIPVDNPTEQADIAPATSATGTTGVGK